MSDCLLDASGLSMRFGGLLAVDNVALTIQRGEIVSMIGPNGAGKTTVFNCLTGFYRATSGQITYHKKAIEKWPGYKIARLGMVRTFQNVRLFKGMTVLENLLVAQHMHLNTGWLSGLFKTPGFRHSEAKALETADHWLNEMGLADFTNREAGNLAYGQQRKLEIARCMVTRPNLLMLDEPAAGLNPRETDELNQLISDLRQQHGVTILLIEHDMKLVMNISDRIYVINQGRPLVSGTPEVVRNHPEVIKAYLGN